MHNETSSGPEIGLSFTSQMHLTWQPFAQATELRDNTEELRLRNRRLLQLLLFYDGYHPEQRTEEIDQKNGLDRIEAKLDAVIQLLSFLCSQPDTDEEQRLVSLSAHYLEWAETEQIAPAVGERLHIRLGIDPRLPQPLELVGSVVQRIPQEVDRVKVRIALHDLGEPLQGILEKVIFRGHRREIARIRAQR